MTRTRRPYWRDTPGQSSILLYTTCRGQYQQVVHMAWWRSGSGCLTGDPIETLPLVSRDLYNLCWRPGPGSCPDSHPLSDLLGGRRYLPEH